MKKKIVVFSLLFSLLFSMKFQMNVMAAGWNQTDDGWWYDNGDGMFNVNMWQRINGFWYYFDEDGYMCTGWMVIDGKKYYFHENGNMACSEWIDKRYLGEDGVMLRNTTTPDGYQVDGDGLWIQNGKPNERPTRGADQNPFAM